MRGVSIFGKIPGRVAEKGKQNDIPVIALAGILEEGWQNLKDVGLTAAHSIAPSGTSKADSITNASLYIEQKTSYVVKKFLGSN